LLELYRADLYDLESCRVSIDLARLVRDAVELNSELARMARVRINLSVASNLPTIEGIPAALRQAFHNLYPKFSGGKLSRTASRSQSILHC